MHIDKNTTASLFRKIVEEESRSAYNEFFNIYYPKFIKIAIFYVKQHHFAEDVISEVLIKIFKNRQKIMNVDNIEGYLFITVKNECLRYLEKNKKFIDMNIRPKVQEVFYQAMKN
ncbi:MAG: hypothetical protein L3J74_15905 [Bacteroidales bacterium]|nr:hypothetical protein [Bacteroidales bacterium]